MKIRYFVSYAHEKGFGRCAISMPKPIDTLDDITDIENSIKFKNPNFKKVTVLYYNILTTIKEPPIK